MCNANKRENPDDRHARELRRQRQIRYRESCRSRTKRAPTGIADTSGQLTSNSSQTPHEMDTPQPENPQVYLERLPTSQCVRICVVDEPQQQQGHVTSTTNSTTCHEQTTVDAPSTSKTTRTINQIQPTVVGEGIANVASDTPTNTNYDAYSFVYDGIPTTHRLLTNRPPCIHCGAKLLSFEFPTFCCMNGKTVLVETLIPPDLHTLFTSQDDVGKVFKGKHPGLQH